jgi:hypothetical protein
MADNPEAAKSAFRTREETSAVALAPEAVLQPGTVSVERGVLSVKNQELGNLIQSRLAAASQLAAADARAATDADVSVSVKVRF